MKEAKYSIGDQISVADLNGKVYRVKINAVTTYSVVKAFSTPEINAQTYPAPHNTLSGEELFYVCGNVEGDAEFNNLVLWDDILDHTKTVYITKSSKYMMTVLPIPLGSGKAVRRAEDIFADIKAAIAANVPDCTIAWEDRTDSEKDELSMLKSEVELCKSLVADFASLEAVRPLITQLQSVDIASLTTNIKDLLIDIQMQLSAITS